MHNGAPRFDSGQAHKGNEMEVREIIKEALGRANIVPRKQPAPGNLVETGLNFLKALAAKFNNDNYLAFTQAKARLPAARVIHLYGDVDTFGGENCRYFGSVSELENPLNIPDAEDVANGVRAMVRTAPGTVYEAVDSMPAPIWQARPVDMYDVIDQQMQEYCTAVHIKIPDIRKLDSLYIKNSPDGRVAQLRLNFIPFRDFDSAAVADLVWTFTELAQGEFVVRTKSYVDSGVQGLSLCYNKGFDFDLDSDLRIPDAYLELLITALTYKLALKHPRLDDAQMQRLKLDLDDMILNVKTPKAEARMVLREVDYSRPMTAYDVLAGAMFR